jgi:RNA polymerase sigma-70 factor (ECF subfamily)
MSDSAILELYLERDESAIAETSRKYGGYCKRVAMNILDNADDVDECVNDAWLAVWNAIPPEKPRSLGGFLAKITRNLSLDRYRARGALKRGGNFVAVLSELDECLPAPHDVQGEFEAGQVAVVINRFLGELPTQQREIFTRRYYSGDSLSDIADDFGMSYSKAASILHRLRGRLKEELQKEGVQI